MSDKFNQLIELLIAEDQEKAQELFHEIVVERSRSIYESLIDDETVEEAAEEEVAEESDFDEELGGDAADDMIADIEADEEGLAVEAEEGDEELEDRVVDLEDALDELKAEFDRLMSDEADDEEAEDEMDMDMDDAEEGDDEMDMDMEEPEAEEEMESAEDFVREYKEKAPAPVTAEQGDGKAGPVAKKNDMGGKATMSKGEEKSASAPKAAKQTDAMDTREAGKAGMKQA